MRFVLFLLLMFLSSAAFATPIEADKSAARIMVYFTVGQDEVPATNVTVEQFKTHLTELAEGDYNVLSLTDIFKAYKSNQPLPDNTVAITFDGGDKSILEKAAPLLESYQFPYTVFIAPDRADRENSPYLSWQDIKTLQKSGLASFGLHPETYTNISKKPAVSIRGSLNNATARFRKKIGSQPKFFAYPFGEYSQSYKDIIADYGFTASFGQQSGVTHAKSDILALPRFTMTENYANRDRFRMTSTALPLPANDISPSISHINNVSPSIGFTVPEKLSTELSALSCFASGQDKPAMSILGNRVELRLKQPISQTRFRVNCTLPVKEDRSVKAQRWRWFGLLLTLDEALLEAQKDPAQ